MTQTYKVQVSMNQAHIVESGFVWKQGDFGFNIEIEVLDFDTTGATPQIIFRKSSGAVEATQISVAGNKFTYAIRGTELDTPGPCVCDLKLKDSTTKRVSTASFKYFVIPDTMDGLNQQASSYSDTIEQIVGGFDGDIENLDNMIYSSVYNGYNNDIEFVQGVRFPQSIQTITPSAIRCTLKNILHLFPGDVIAFTDNTSGQKYALSSNSYDSGWKTSDFSYTITTENYYSVTIAKSDGTSAILPSEIGLEAVVTINSSIPAKNATNYQKSLPTLNIANPVFSMYDDLENVQFNNGTSSWFNAGNRLCKKMPTLATDKIKIVAKSGYRFCIYLWNGPNWTDGFISSSAWLTEGVVDKNAYYSLLISRSDNTNINISEGINVYGISYNTEAFVNNSISDAIINSQSEINLVIRNRNLFENKVFNGSTFVSSSSRICNTTLLYAEKDYKITGVNGFQVTPALFLTNDYTQGPVLYGDPWATSCTIPAGFYFLINIRKSDNSNITVNDIVNIYQDNFGYLYDRLKENTDFSAYLKNNKKVISDPDIKGVNAQCMTYDPYTGKVYIVYMSSDENYGESSQKIMLSVFSLANPEKFESYVVAENGVAGVERSYEPNILNLENSVRIIYATVENYQYKNVYTDFSKTAHTFSTPIEQKYGDDSIVNTNNTKQYITDHGYDVSGMGISYQAITNFTEPHDGYIYTVLLSSGDQIPILCRSNDNMATIERLCFLPYNGKGETALEFIDDRLYMLARLADSVAQNNNFYYTDDMSTIVEIGKVEISNSKPTMAKYDGKILICRNTTEAGVPTINRMGRYQITISIFDGNKMVDILKANDYWGIVYTMIKNYKNQLIATFSEGSLFYDLDEYGQGKDTVDFVNFGLISDLLL